MNPAAVKAQAQSIAQKYGKTVNEKLLTQVLANRSGQLNCLTCAKGSAKVQGALRPVSMTFKTPPPPPATANPTPLPSSAPITEPGDNGSDYIKPHNPVDWSSKLETRDSFARLW